MRVSVHVCDGFSFTFDVSFTPGESCFRPTQYYSFAMGKARSQSTSALSLFRYFRFTILIFVQSIITLVNHFNNKINSTTSVVNMHVHVFVLMYIYGRDGINVVI